MLSFLKSKTNIGKRQVLYLSFYILTRNKDYDRIGKRVMLKKTRELLKEIKDRIAESFKSLICHPLGCVIVITFFILLHYIYTYYIK